MPSANVLLLKLLSVATETTTSVAATSGTATATTNDVNGHVGSNVRVMVKLLAQHLASYVFHTISTPAEQGRCVTPRAGRSGSDVGIDLVPLGWASPCLAQPLRPRFNGGELPVECDVAGVTSASVLTTLSTCVRTYTSVPGIRWKTWFLALLLLPCQWKRML